MTNESAYSQIEGLSGRSEKLPPNLGQQIEVITQIADALQTNLSEEGFPYTRPVQVGGVKCTISACWSVDTGGSSFRSKKIGIKIEDVEFTVILCTKDGFRVSEGTVLVELWDLQGGQRLLELGHIDELRNGRILHKAIESLEGTSLTIITPSRLSWGTQSLLSIIQEGIQRAGNESPTPPAPSLKSGDN